MILPPRGGPARTAGRLEPMEPKTIGRLMRFPWKSFVKSSASSGVCVAKYGTDL